MGRTEFRAARLHKQSALLLGAVIASWALVGCQTLHHGASKSEQQVFSAESIRGSKHEPAARSLHTALWTGEGMLVWGGSLEENVAYDSATGGAIYYPETKKWWSLPKNQHSSRYHHSAVWTGIQMIVWGGVADKGSGPMQTGLMLDMQDEEWFPVAEEGAPTARSGHSAVWTGERMIVWGGETGEGQMQADGGSYDLVQDKWELISADNAPDTRSFHSAVWTGDQMIVFGGLNEKGALSSGGVYDPTTGFWENLPSEGAPSPRYSHTVVWTGNKMIVWGGRNSKEEYLNDGAVYDPRANKWTKLSAKDAPSGRELHTAVWTGTEMVVFGGHDAGRPLADGGTYDPATNSWTKWKTDRKASARYQHAAVWTGNDLLVWGGKTKGGKFVKKKNGFAVHAPQAKPSKKGQALAGR